MYPDITDIVRVSLNVADNILFFLPRSLDLDELFSICSEVKNEMEENSGKRLFFDIQILKSNGRIKSLLIIFIHDVNKTFRRDNLEDFLNKHYKHVNDTYINNLYSIINTIGCFNFFKEEYLYRTSKSKCPELDDLIEYLKENCLTDNKKLIYYN